MATLLLGALALPAYAQPAPEGEPTPAESGGRGYLWSRASRQDRVVWSQWTRHLSDTRTHISNDKIIAVVYRGYFAGTFRTTHDGRAYSLGVEREWLSSDRGIFGVGLGFRAGLVYGYDEQLGWLAAAVPILPFVSPMVQGRMGPITAELTHTWVVLSLTAGFRF